ncbi:hypothetical protein [Kiritimatiella glycovorans]|uniref:Uncharacterized protein n=1 Tax=Kiritimatiella glycovorans TaxID=1307763 RepID=A0A0G3EFP4_9BACT|nr:hypothetical protein [Kiritimatiella glycovorans]AKJ64227.1 hypothetical protein L21SP4_00967 [Kiritimatiella glycovorans]
MAKKKSSVQQSEAADRRKRRAESKEAFRRQVFDKRRYRSFSVEELQKIQSICDEWIERKKAKELETLKKEKDDLDKRIQALKK